MSEDISAQIRTGVTVILVAALVAAILSLMVVAQSVLSNGMSTFQSGVDRITLQEYQAYNQTKKTGVEVVSALSLYEGRDIAIVVRTAACINNEANGAWAYNYGSLLSGATSTTTTEAGTTYYISSALTKHSGDSYYTAAYSKTNGVIGNNANIKGTTVTGYSEFILSSARFRAELIQDESGTIIGILFTQLQ